MWRLAHEEAQWAELYRGEIDRVLAIASEIAATLAVMHEVEPRCVHRDVNASNVLFATPGGTPILADFGIAHLSGYAGRPENVEAATSSSGESSAPWRWRPPELLNAGAESTPAADVFMLGGLIVEALSSGCDLPDRAYWPDAELPAHPEHLLVCHAADPRAGSVRELVSCMLSSDPTHRPSARAVAHACRELRRPATEQSTRRFSVENE